jgi:biopolymer transport protein TolQ
MNAFISAYIESDGFGRAIFLTLFALSLISWWLLLSKSWILFQMQKSSLDITSAFSRKDPLGLQYLAPKKPDLIGISNPFFEIYKAFKQSTLQIMSRNTNTIVSDADLNFIDAEMDIVLQTQIQQVEKNVFLLSTIAALSPLLGLLGTVWGILVAFGEQTKGGVIASNTTMLSGLSLALTTTVIGLVVAIPALVGYSYLRNRSKEYKKEMQDFSHLLISVMELHYRKKEVYEEEKVSITE